MDFELMLTQARRDDDYVNATELCKKFGKEWRRFNETPHTKRLKALLRKDMPEKTATLRVGNSKFICPELAIAVVQVANILDFQPLKKNAPRELKPILGKAFQPRKCFTELNP